MHGYALLMAFALLRPVVAVAAGDVAVIDAYFEDADRAIVRQLQLSAGDPLYLSFRIAGFRADAKKQVRLTYWIDCLDPEKAPLAETFSEKIEQTLAPQDEKWTPKVVWSLGIPTYAPGGEYQVAIRVRDEIAGKEARHQMRFQVRGAPIDTAAALGVTNFEFADTEEGQAKEAPTFSPGSQLWARFRLVGFKVAPDKQISVEEDVTVLDSEGKVIFSRPQAMVENQRNFYPPRFLTAAFNLELQPKLRPGEYTIRLDIRDLVAQQNTRYETRFTVLP